MVTFESRFLTPSEGDLADAIALGRAQGAMEVWVFGSAAHADPDNHASDFDMAILGIEPSRVNDATAALRSRFPTSRVEAATGYTTPRVAHSSTLPFHFLLSTRAMERTGHPIYQSIRRGRRLW